MEKSRLSQFAIQYTAAWCSQDAAKVAEFFAPHGTLAINESSPSIGRAVITATVQEFKTAFPDLVVMMDRLDVEELRSVYHWTLVGTNTGPGGTGKAVRVSGYEDWRMNEECLISESKGHFDEAEYRRQLEIGND